MFFTTPAKGIPTGPIAQDGHDEFARNITAKDQDISLIEFSSVDKLAKTDIRPVNICREIQPHSALPSLGDPEASGSPKILLRTPLFAKRQLLFRWDILVCLGYIQVPCVLANEARDEVEQGRDNDAQGSEEHPSEKGGVQNVGTPAKG